MARRKDSRRCKAIKEQNDEKMVRIKELKQQLEELENDGKVEHDEKDMSVDEDTDEECDDEEWAEWEKRKIHME